MGCSLLHRYVCGKVHLDWVYMLNSTNSHKYHVALSHLQASEKHSDGIVSLAIAAHYFFGEDQKSPQLYALLERLPNWTFSSGWSCTYDLFVF